MDAPTETSITPSGAFSLVRSLSPLRHGPRDPSVRIDDHRVLRAVRTPSGPAAMAIEARSRQIVVRAWGPGADHALATAPDLLGARDDVADWEPARHGLVRELDRRFPGLRMIATGAVFDAAVPAVIEQKVTSREAHASWHRLVWSLGDPAPGPFRLRVPPTPEQLASTPYFTYHGFGIERRRADVIRRLASRAVRVEEASCLPSPLRRARLEAFPGVGPWTSAEVAAVAWADADAVSVGDYHVAPNVVYAFTGRRGGDDDAMLELLEPFRPHRGRVARLVMLSGIRPARRAPGRPLRDLRAI